MVATKRYLLAVNGRFCGEESTKLDGLRSEIVACLNAGDSVRVYDSLRDKMISIEDLRRLLVL